MAKKILIIARYTGIRNTFEFQDNEFRGYLYGGSSKISGVFFINITNSLLH